MVIPRKVHLQTPAPLGPPLHHLCVIGLLLFNLGSLERNVHYVPLGPDVDLGDVIRPPCLIRGTTFSLSADTIGSATPIYPIGAHVSVPHRSNTPVPIRTSWIRHCSEGFAAAGGVQGRSLAGTVLTADELLYGRVELTLALVEGPVSDRFDEPQCRAGDA